MRTDSLSKKDVEYLYGLNLTEHDIKNLYPYDEGTFDATLYSSDRVTITSNPYHAMQFRNDNYPILAWGSLYKGQRVFAFQREAKRLTLNF